MTRPRIPALLLAALAAALPCGIARSVTPSNEPDPGPPPDLSAQEVLPALRSAALDRKIPLSGFDPFLPGRVLKPGDSVTSLITVTKGRHFKQWVAELIVVGPAGGATGRVADGTITWMTGTGTIADHIAPTITAAAEAAGRPAPRVVVSLPMSVTADSESAKGRINEAFSIYPNLPSYRAMLDKEGAEAAGDIAFIGDEEAVAASIVKLADAGATDFVGAIVGDAAEQARGFALLSELARS